MVGRDFASVNIFPAATLLTLSTFGSKRSITTANPRRASELNSIASWRFSPTVSSDLAGARRNSITLGSGALTLGVSLVTALFGARSSAGAAPASFFKFSAVVETSVDGDTTFLIAVATSIFGGAASVCAKDADFGCGIEASACPFVLAVSFTVWTGWVC